MKIIVTRTPRGGLHGKLIITEDFELSHETTAAEPGSFIAMARHLLAAYRQQRQRLMSEWGVDLPMPPADWAMIEDRPDQFRFEPLFQKVSL